MLSFGILWKITKKGNWPKKSNEHIDDGLKHSRKSEYEYTTLDAHVGIDLNDDETIQVTPHSQPIVRDEEKRKDK